jgi:hypothetical protein
VSSPPGVWTAGGVNCAARCRIWKSITNSFAATAAVIPSKTLSPSVPHATPARTSVEGSPPVSSCTSRAAGDILLIGQTIAITSPPSLGGRCASALSGVADAGSDLKSYSPGRQWSPCPSARNWIDAAMRWKGENPCTARTRPVRNAGSQPPANSIY